MDAVDQEETAEIAAKAEDGEQANKGDLFRARTTIDDQNDLEKQRAWIRKRNCKIYDNKI